MSLPHLTLYLAPGACSLIPHILLEHLSIPHTTVVLSTGPEGLQGADGSFTNAEYRRRVHHAGYVPALAVTSKDSNEAPPHLNDAHTATILTENPAVLTYIAALKPDAHVMGHSTLDAAKVQGWLVWLSGTLQGMGLAMLFRPGRFASDEAMHAAIRARGTEVVSQSLELIEARIKAGGEWALGKELTVVDIALYVFARAASSIDVDMGKCENLSRIAKRVEKLEGTRRALGDEKIEAKFDN